MTDADRDRLIAALPESQRHELAALDRAIRAAAPSLHASIGDGGLGYGRYSYRYATGREGDWFVLSVVPRAKNLTLYVGGTAVEQWADRLPSRACGKGCIRLKRAADLPPDVLEEIAAWATSINGKLLDWKGRDQLTDRPAIRDRLPVE
jgi:hypothetical protein